MMPSEESLPRMGGLGITGVVQPRFVHDFGQPLIMTGADRELRVLPFRDLLDQGLVLAGSSDAPGATRRSFPRSSPRSRSGPRTGKCWAADQVLSVEEALAMYTAARPRCSG